MANSLKPGVLTLNGKTFTKNSFTGSTPHQGGISFQSFSIVNDANRIRYHIIGYEPTWEYKVYFSNGASIEQLAKNNSRYDFKIEDGCFFLYEYDPEGPLTFLIVGVEG